MDVTELQPGAAPQSGVPPPQAQSHVSFHDVLSALNPLQYLPVIGTIYRGVTGNQIPEAMRRVGSLIASTLIGGPIGAAINLATLAVEKITGVDLDQTGQTLLTGPGSEHLPADAAASLQPAVGDAAATGAASPRQAWSPAQLAAYGATAPAPATLKMAGLKGADVLNTLELHRIRDAQAAYGRTANL